MSKLFIFFFFLLCIQEEPVITWSKDTKLAWEDFKAKPKTDSSAVAITASGITFGFSIKSTDKNEVLSFNTDVNAYFYPEQSWYKPERATKDVLGHEQLHFSITELHARKFRARIEQLKVSNRIRVELKKLQSTINRELAEMQNRYDFETDFSRNKENQEKWHRFVNAELNKYDNYKSIEAN
ncbi:DUF922 domain-containing protein [Hyunsoonleella aestuarii]|uniref:DUF922 domain-containing protein n=1 Tax=Hyunsoonleella aestuarii TaxID=912802 RepID=A0ABP8EC83_9FLAO|nr:DUF922 domain-containing protein [Hyunsoonleella aestuarii]